MADNKKIKAFSIAKGLDATADDLAKINKYSVGLLGADDVYLFKIEMCSNEIDRVGDKLTGPFLKGFADKVKGRPLIKGHDWDNVNPVARIYDAEVVVDASQHVGDEPKVYVLGKAYALRSNKEDIDMIDAGILKECSVSFGSSGDKCSICGCGMVHGFDGIGVCEKGHRALEMYEGEQCSCIIDNCEDAFECSLVAVPCQRNSQVKKKGIGGIGMTRMQLLVKRLVSSKSVRPCDLEELQKGLKNSEEEITEEDVDALISENTALRVQVKSLNEKVDKLEKGLKAEKVRSVVSKAIDGLKPLNAKVKELMEKEVPWEDLQVNDKGEVEGIEEVVTKLEKDFEGLVGEKETEEIGGHDEPDGDEAGVVYVNDKSEPDGDEGKLMVMDKGCFDKALKPGVGQGKGKKVTKSFKPGINV